MNFGLESSASLLNRLYILVHLGHCVFELPQCLLIFFLLLLRLLQVQDLIQQLLREKGRFRGKLSFNVELLDQLFMQSLELLQIGVVTKDRQTTVRKERLKK